jgi:SPX domain protein involved in polyphosphate accumulation
MKFGETLTRSFHPSFRNYYIAYNDLKKAIKIITGELVPSDEDISSPLVAAVMIGGTGPATQHGSGGVVLRRTAESQFQDLLDHELEKINNFSNVEFRVLLEEIRDLLYRLTALSASASLRDTRESIEALKSEIIAFDGYIRLNFSGFRKALKKFDKCNSSNSSNWFLQRVVRSDFMLVPMDRLIHGIAVLEFKFRSVTTHDRSPLTLHPSQLAVYSDPGRYRRLKFFIPPEDLVGIEMEILREMNAVFGRPLSVHCLGADELVDGFKTNIVAVGRPSSSVGAPDIAFTENVVIFEDDQYSVYGLRRSKKPATETGSQVGYATSVFSIRWNQYQGKEGKCCVVRECHPRYATAGARLHFLQLKQKQVP